MLQPFEVVLSIAPASTTSGSHWRAVCRQSVLAGKHERAAAAIAIQVDVKEQLQQQMGALTAAQSGGLQDDRAGEDEGDEVVTVDDDAPINLSQFGKAFKVSKASALPLAQLPWVAQDKEERMMWQQPLPYQHAPYRKGMTSFHPYVIITPGR